MLSIKYKDGVAWLLDNESVVYTFELGANIIDIGKGENKFSMSHGSFKIKEKISLRKCQFIKEISYENDTLRLKLENGDLELSINDNKLYVKPVGFDGYNRMWIMLPAINDEYVYGTGEIFTEFNLRGKKVNAWVAEHINGLQVGKKILKQVVGIKNTTHKQKFSNYETYYVQPTFISSRKYFFHSFTTARAEFDFTKNDKHIIKIDEIAPFCMGFEADFEKLQASLSQVLGRQPELPDWVYDGEILGIQGGTEVMLNKIDTALSHGLNVAGAWIQDWEGRRVTAVGKQLYWNWQYDEELYPNLPQTITELNEKGIKVLGYINPFLAVEKPLYKEASEKGYCVKKADGSDYYVTITTFPAAMVDFTNPEAYNWIKNIIKENMIGIGLSGWMADFGEYLPTDCVLYSGEDAELVHNTWAAIWAKINREAIEECGKLGEIMFFTRAGYSATPKYSTMMWNGDNHVDYSIDFGLPSVIPAMLSLTCSGFGLSHSDIGGYTTFLNLKRSEELYMRWCEMNAFSPLMRGHEGLNPDLNVQFDANERVLAHGAKMDKIHKALKPYLKDAVKLNSQKGIGVVRPLFFYYDEQKAFEECYEYMLGRDILVAPVIKSNATNRTVYLPNDNWVHLWSGMEYAGGNHTVDAPVGEIPVFVRKSAQSVLDILNNAK